ncbi:universal stress protein [Halopiger goleimassiliensis]|uniref:universal stress protein n=1 Tax=Halopiger goleimassiliensis TaxID=1293048 RepID=UPI000677D9EF|nr:universal stress protein [Halopiger goleimassiliensis]
MGEHVLVPIDRSSQSENAFEYVLENIPEPTVTLIHVISPPSAFSYGSETDLDLDLERYRAEAHRRRDEADALLEEYRESAAERGIPADTVVRVGKPAGQILEAAENRDVDHIVMGSHGRTGAGRVLFGSVAETVTRRATVPVTIVR